MRLRLLVLWLLALVITTACNAATPEPKVAATDTPRPAPTETVPPTDTPSNTAIATATDSPPTATSAPTPKAAQPAAFNPDLDFAQVTFVKATQTGENTWRFDTTVRHNDEGWEHYADLWDVVDLEGNMLAERVLLHPHDTEQPFTRSQNGVEIAPDMTQVVVRAKCNVHGFGGQEILVDLTLGQGENFEVEK